MGPIGADGLGHDETGRCGVEEVRMEIVKVCYPSEGLQWRICMCLSRWLYLLDDMPPFLFLQVAFPTESVPL